jgi:hypothetical protein
MKPAFPILLLVTLLTGASGAQAASTGAIGSNPLLPPPSAITPLPQTNPGLLGPNAFGAQSPGALPGTPGSPTYNPFGALPSLNNPGTSSFAARNYDHRHQHSRTHYSRHHQPHWWHVVWKERGCR